MVDQHGSVIHLMNPVNVTRISIAGLVDRVFKLKVSCIMIIFLLKHKNLGIIFFVNNKNTSIVDLLIIN